MDNIATQTQQTATKQSVAQLQTGLTIFQTEPVTLAWNQGDTITLTNNNTKQVLFSVQPASIAHASGMNGQFAIKLQDGKRYNLIFDENAINNMAGSTVGGALGGGLGAGVMLANEIEQAKNEQATDIAWWQQALKEHGVKSSYFSQKTMWMIAIPIAVIFVILLIATGGLH